MKRITGLALVAAMSLSMVTGVSANTVNINLDTNQISDIGTSSSSEVKFSYGFVSGKVIDITNSESTEGCKYITIEDENGKISTLLLTDSTYVASDVEIAKGNVITGYYDVNAPMIMIYPPQYTAEVIAVENEGQTVKVDKFDEELVSSDNTLQLNITDDTKIVSQDGTEFKGQIANKKLIVTYDRSTRSIPAQTNPIKVVVLADEAEDIAIADKNVKVDTFDKDLISSDNFLQLNISEDTEIVTEDGEAYTGDLAGKKLSVTYTFTTMSIPAQTNPIKVVVLSEKTIPQNVKVDTFDKDLVSSDNTLQLNLAEDTEIVSENGEAYTGDLAGKKLSVSYTFTTRSIPAQTTPVKVVVLSDEQTGTLAQNVKVDTFNKDLVSSDNTLQLNIAEDTKIVSQNGKDYKGDLAGKKLSVTYTYTTRSIPAQTTPIKVVVLDDTKVDVSNMSIVVNGKKVNGSSAYTNANGTVMVPVSKIAQSLDYKVKWNGKTKTVTIGNGIECTVGSDNYIYFKTTPYKLGTAPELVKGKTYVPLTFFSDVLNMNAGIVDGQIVIEDAK